MFALYHRLDLPENNYVNMIQLENYECCFMTLNKEDKCFPFIVGAKVTDTKTNPSNPYHCLWTQPVIAEFHIHCKNKKKSFHSQTSLNWQFTVVTVFAKSKQAVCGNKMMIRNHLWEQAGTLVQWKAVNTFWMSELVTTSPKSLTLSGSPSSASFHWHPYRRVWLTWGKNI